MYSSANWLTKIIYIDQAHLPSLTPHHYHPLLGACVVCFITFLKKESPIQQPTGSCDVQE